MAEEKSANEQSHAGCCHGNREKTSSTAEGHSCHGASEQDHAHEGCCQGKGKKTPDAAKAGT